MVAAAVGKPVIVLHLTRLKKRKIKRLIQKSKQLLRNISESSEIHFPVKLDDHMDGK